MSAVIRFSFIASSLVCFSCATPALWEATDPREYVAMTRSAENEDKLASSGLTYRIDENRDLIYVEKTRIQKSRDYAIRAIGIPVTVVLDTAATIVVVGAAVYVLAHANGYIPNIPDDLPEEREWKSLEETVDSMRRENWHESDASLYGGGIP